MDMEKFLTSLVFREAPLDVYGTSVLTAGAIKQLVSDGVTKPGPLKEDAEKEQGFSSKSTQQRRAGFELAFDGLNCFDSVVMH
ncbi:uncharacterized protein LOC124682776 [Lolium rigidum]|uniref:uncharacterized protein LOC124682776 n=1 Tax=Lolium rigidum TaxID=89674 RepID=UPI001F5D1113|nr:uncharacterized protein LOC124682776 [Lolium rigidum]